MNEDQPGVSSTETTRGPEYPDELATAETKFLERRRAAVARDGIDDPPSRLGVGISGGGIRSATFALGFFQTLASNDCTKHIDYLSTVSGGGYFGGFFGALFRRDNVHSHDDVKSILEPHAQTDVLRYLRENGSYLAPAGTDSLLLGAATLFRNWCVVQLLVLMALFGGFLFLQTATAFVQMNPQLTAAAHGLPLWEAFASQDIALSPWFAVAVALTAFWVIPLTWSYWAIGRDVSTSSRGTLRAFLKVIWTVLLYVPPAAGGYILAVRFPEHHELGMAIAGVSAVALSTGQIAMLGQAKFAAVFAFTAAALPVVACACAAAASRSWVPGIGALALALACVMFGREAWLNRVVKAGTPRGGPSGVRELDEDNEGRYELSSALKTALVVTAAILALALIDTAARSFIIRVLREHDLAEGLAKRGIGFGTFIALASSALRRAWALFSKPPGKGDRPGLPVKLIAGVVALVVVIGLLLACDAAAYAAVELLRHRDVSTFGQHCAIALGAVLIVNLILGSSRNLLNASTQLPLYSARLIRAYLGASNPKRLQHDVQPASKRVPEPQADSAAPANDTSRQGDSERPAGNTSTANDNRSREVAAGKPSPTAATRIMEGDDIPAQSYWCWDNGVQDVAGAKSEDPYAKGAPLHLVNVTINETVDGRSQIQQGDRKGVGLAIGPGGFSAGVRHHAVFFDRERISFPHTGWKVFRFEEDAAKQKDLNVVQKLWRATAPSHWINRQHVLENFPFDQLSFGQWLGISGAAFSTGLGSRTNVGLSVLAALANVRLGFWWRPGIKTSVSWLHKVGVLFWVQTYLFRELLARFPGTSRALWYLSDGGHFENLGGYELIRRSLPYVLLIDAEEDPKYQCESLANLVRKARLDFGAEIEFLEHPSHIFADSRQWPQFTGTLSELQRGDWSQNTASSSAAWKLTAAAPHGLSRAHAALAQITYRDSKKGWLLYVKPTLIGEESQDLRNYHLAHPAFPHEPTTDQFFDEAQWESYRFLGQRIAERLLEQDGVLQKFFDRDLPSHEDGRAQTTSSKPVPKTGVG